MARCPSPSPAHARALNRVKHLHFLAGFQSNMEAYYNQIYLPTCAL